MPKSRRRGVALTKNALLFSAAVFCASAVDAYAQKATEGTVLALLQDCRADTGTPDFFLCLGKVIGIAEMAEMNGFLYRAGKGGTELTKVASCPKANGAKAKRNKKGPKSSATVNSDGEEVGSGEEDKPKKRGGGFKKEYVLRSVPSSVPVPASRRLSDWIRICCSLRGSPPAC